MIVKVAGIAYDASKGNGISILNRLIDAGFRAECIAIGESFKHLPTKAPTQIQLYRGPRGLDGGTIERYRSSAEEDRSDFTAAFDGADIIFLTGDLGDPVGAGATPVVAECAKSVGALTIAVVTRPFRFEGERRQKNFDRALEELKATVDLIAIFSKEYLFRVVDPKMPMTRVFDIVDDVVCWIVGSALKIFEPTAIGDRLIDSSVLKIFDGATIRLPPTPVEPPPTPALSSKSKLVDIPSWMRRR